MTCAAIHSFAKPITRFQRLPETHGCIPCVFSFALHHRAFPGPVSFAANCINPHQQKPFPPGVLRQPKLFSPIPGLVSSGRLLPNKFPSGNPPRQSQLTQFSISLLLCNFPLPKLVAALPGFLPSIQTVFASSRPGLPSAAPPSSKPIDPFPPANSQPTLIPAGSFCRPTLLDPIPFEFPVSAQYKQ